MRASRLVRHAVMVASTALLATACGGGGGDDTEPTPTSTTTTVASTTTPDEATADDEVSIAPLTGETLDPGERPEARALMVKIGNDDDRARPQTGLVEADIVYEVLIEGLKTRFAAVFHTEIPDRVGPIRSGRSSDIDLLADLGRPYLAYSGGNPTVLGQFRTAAAAGVFVDAGILGFEPPYTRDESRDAPDNLYFDFREIVAERGDAPPPALFDYDSRSGIDEADLGDGIVVRYPTSFGRVSIHIWDDAARGWVRIQDGTVHTAETADGEVEIAPTNIVVLETNYIESAADAESPQAVTFGSARAWVLVAGRVLEGRWERTQGQPGLTLVDAAGTPIGLEPGSTWVLLANDGLGSDRFGAAEIEVLDPVSAASMLAEARELAAGNGDSSS